MEAPVNDAVARRLSEVERRVSGRLAAALQRQDSSLEEWRVLAALAGGAARPMGEIAELGGLPSPTLSRIVDRLVLAGLLRRETDDRDRRRVLITLATGGRARYRELRGLVEAEEAALRTLIGTRDLAELERLLALAAQRLRHAGIEHPGS